MKFYDAIVEYGTKSLNNYFFDNHDHYRFGGIAGQQGIMTPFPVELLQQRIAGYKTYIDRLEKTYDLLNDSYSKETLVKLICFRLMGAEKIRMIDNYLSKVQEIDMTMRAEPADAIRVGFMNWNLHKFNLEKLGYDLYVYYVALGVYFTFVAHCYNYIHDNTKITVEDGDYIIDAGACYGDTALHFSKMIGEKGKVFSFELLEENINIFNKNMEINNIKNVSLSNKIIWDKDDEILNFAINGPGSSVHDTGTLQFKSITIDSFIKQENTEKVDFIKMDIEGSELKALIGAEEVLRKYTPKLAISVYHKVQDLYEIPEYLDSLQLGYSFYLDHTTIHNEETVLYAIKR